MWGDSPAQWALRWRLVGMIAFTTGEFDCDSRPSLVRLGNQPTNLAYLSGTLGTCASGITVAEVTLYEEDLLASTRISTPAMDKATRMIVIRRNTVCNSDPSFKAQMRITKARKKSNPPIISNPRSFGRLGILPGSSRLILRDDPLPRIGLLEVGFRER